MTEPNDAAMQEKLAVYEVSSNREPLNVVGYQPRGPSQMHITPPTGGSSARKPTRNKEE